MSLWYDILEEVPEEDRTIVSLSANRYMNMVGGCRPSDAVRWEVDEYKRDPVRYVQRFHEVRA